MGFALFRKPPTSLEIRAFLGRVIHGNPIPPLGRGGRGDRAHSNAAPKYIICDKGSQFWPCPGVKRWCKRQGIRPRFGAIGKHGSIAVIERAIKTIKREGLAGITTRCHPKIGGRLGSLEKITAYAVSRRIAMPRIRRRFLLEPAEICVYHCMCSPSR